MSGPVPPVPQKVDVAGKIIKSAAGVASIGAAGIAVGMATNIPPHNLGEIIDGLLLLLQILLR